MLMGFYRRNLGKFDVWSSIAAQTVSLIKRTDNHSYSTGTSQVDAQFGVSEEVGTLGTALLLFGFGMSTVPPTPGLEPFLTNCPGLGPLVWAPLSEVYGRKPAVLIPYFIAAIFSFGTATAKDLQTVMITRFFAGFFGSAPVTNTGGVLGDIWTAEQRGAAIVGYAMAVVAGPILGPIVGGAVVQSYLGWRWTEYVSIYKISPWNPRGNGANVDS